MWPLGAKIKLGACGVEAKNCPADSGPRRPRRWGVRGEGGFGGGGEVVLKKRVMRTEVNKSEE